MADALDSKSSVRKDVRVQVPPPVLLMGKGLTAIGRKSFFFRDKAIQRHAPVSCKKICP